MATIDLSTLNKQQRQAVTTGKGHRLVLAGAGTGKTTMLTYRVAYLLSQGVDPDKILLLTFTNKAADNIKARVSALLNAPPICAGTFHHFGNSFIRNYANQLGMAKNYTILEPDECVEILKILKAPAKLEKDIYKWIKHHEMWHVPLKQETPKEYFKVTQKLYKAYQKYKQENHYVDFEDLLFIPLKFLQDNPKLTLGFEYILVDEYQDTCKTQIIFLQELLRQATIMAVGDPNQSIYRFRGARFENIMEFKKDFQNAQILKLESNYRSTTQILSLANEIASSISSKNNVHLRSKAVVPTGPKPIIMPFLTVDQQVFRTVDIIHSLIKQGEVPPEEIAILYRSNYGSEKLEVQLRSFNIDYIKYGGRSIFDLIHIKQFIALLGAFYTNKNALNWVKVLTMFKGVGPAAAAHAYQFFLKNKNFDELHDKSYHAELSCLIKTRKKFKQIDKNSLAERLELCYSYYRSLMPEIFNNKHQYRVESLKIFLKSLQQTKHKRIGELLRSFKLERKLEKDTKNKIVLSTIHSAKGLEFESVFVHGVGDKNIPSSMIESGNAVEQNEERRVLYVALTRAKQQLILTYIENGPHSNLTPFLSQIENLKLIVDRYSFS